MTAAVGTTLQKGDELGFFTCGGSDIIILLQAATTPEMVDDDNRKYRLYGTQIAKCSPRGQRTNSKEIKGKTCQ